MGHSFANNTLRYAINIPKAEIYVFYDDRVTLLALSVKIIVFTGHLV